MTTDQGTTPAAPVPPATSAALAASAASSAPDAPAKSSSRRRAILASMVGTIVEWYDFAIYGAASSLVFGKVFFPNVDPVIGLLASYGSFAAGFFARPFGGIFFSYFGDKFGRKPVLIATLTVMGLATTIIGLLPTYQSIGVWAPVLLVCMRLLQGFGAGGEFSGAILFASEYAPPRKRGFYGSFAPASVMIALFLSAGMFAGLAFLPNEQFMAWGWRVPFLLSMLAVIIGYFIRRRVDETPEYLAVREQARKVRAPMIEVLRQHPRLMVLAVGTNIVQVMGYLYTVFTTSYITSHLGLSKTLTLSAQMINFSVAAVVCVAGGALSDVVGRKRVLISAAVASALYAFPFFWLIDTREPMLVALAMGLAAVVLYPIFGTQSAFLTDLFETKFRYSGITFARETAYAVFGGPLPLVATAAVAAAGGASWPVSIIMIVMSLTSALCLALLPRDAGESSVRPRATDENAGRLTAAPPPSELPASELPAIPGH